MKVSLIVAADENNVIGVQNKLPWHLPEDLQHFRKVTADHPIIMGRKTYESIGRPLPGRRNIVITRQKNFKRKGIEIVPTLDKALKAASLGEGDEAFVIGGGEIFRLAMPIAQRIYFTRIHGAFEGDITFPAIEEKEWRELSREKHEADEKNPHTFTFLLYERKQRP
jgi:dihydrofolate reductase